MSETTAECSRCASARERGDHRCPVCGLANLEGVREDLPVTSVEVLRCEGCGAAMSYSASAGAPSCAFCGSVLHLETFDDPLEQADALLPFTFSRSRAEELFRGWLDSLGWFRPSDLSSTSRLESLQALWWVGWTFSTEALVSWAADSDVGTGRADWAPHVGRTEMAFEDVVAPASRGLSEAEALHLIDSYDLSSAASPESMTEPEGVAERFEVRRSQARRHVTAMIERLTLERLHQGVIPGRRFRNESIEVLARRLVTRRLGFPAWVFAYRYRGTAYRFVISGQDPECRLGDAPISVGKIALTVTAGLAALLGLLAVLVL